MKEDRPITDNDLNIIMGYSLKAAAGLSDAATRVNGPNRQQYLSAMHSLLIAVEQARQVAGRSIIISATDEEIEARHT